MNTTIASAPAPSLLTKLRITRDPAEWLMAYVLTVVAAFAAYPTFIAPVDGFGIFKVMLLLLAPAWLILMWQFLFGMQMKRDSKQGERACAS